MKNAIRSLSSFTFLGMMLVTSNIASAQAASSSTTSTTTTAPAPAPATTTTTTTATTSDGTVSVFSPDTIVVKSTTSTTPLTYSYSKTTTYVDENGNAVSSETVKSGAPVTVYYTQDGDKMIATKVVVKKTTTTTTP
jgi:hypothetical protein